MNTCRLVVVVLALTLACTARGQGLGPPLPDMAETPTVGLGSFPAGGEAASGALGMNPLEMLESAGRSLPGGSRALSGAGPGESKGGLSTAVNILVVLTVVTLAPSIMLMTTCFMRILIVLGLLKQAMGAQSVPPPQVITALSLFMTLLVMSPTLDRINEEAVVPYRAGEVSDYDTLWTLAKQPVRDFMFDQIDATGNWSSLYMVLEYRGFDTSEPENLTRADVDMVTLIPAYMLSELKVAFLMGFRVYLPFLVILLYAFTIEDAHGWFGELEGKLSEKHRHIAEHSFA